MLIHLISENATIIEYQWSEYLKIRFYLILFYWEKNSGVETHTFFQFSKAIYSFHKFGFGQESSQTLQIQVQEEINIFSNAAWI